MNFKLLIDECLSPELVDLAVAAGYVESTCVRNMGWQGKKDWELITLVVAGDYSFVTLNSIDFRGAGPVKLGGEHAKQPIHAGLICLNSELPMSIDRQRDLFQIALDELSGMQDLVNQALEVFEDENGQVTAIVYEIPE
ncbi:DUF5615 family PIN-like protein [Rudaea sp.]|uniref:DUF5615 family PIN-like protein n=1 Tax=Rudaea sp. TaxID=2136325 RepID=UPI003783DBDB